MSKSKAKTPVMAFWGYDQFPFLKWGVAEKSKCQSETYWVESYKSFMRPKFTMPMNEGLELAQDLSRLESERMQTLESIEEGFQARLLATLTAHGK